MTSDIHQEVGLHLAPLDTEAPQDRRVMMIITATSTRNSSGHEYVKGSKNRSSDTELTIVSTRTFYSKPERQPEPCPKNSTMAPFSEGQKSL